MNLDYYGIFTKEASLLDEPVAQELPAYRGVVNALLPPGTSRPSWIPKPEAPKPGFLQKSVGPAFELGLNTLGSWESAAPSFMKTIKKFPLASTIPSVGLGRLGAGMLAGGAVETAANHYVPRLEENGYWSEVGNRLRDKAQSAASGATAGTVAMGPGIGTTVGTIANGAWGLVGDAAELGGAGVGFLKLRGAEQDTAGIANRLQSSIAQKKTEVATHLQGQKDQKALGLALTGGAVALGGLGVYSAWRNRKKRIEKERAARPLRRSRI